MRNIIPFLASIAFMAAGIGCGGGGGGGNDAPAVVIGETGVIDPTPPGIDLATSETVIGIWQSLGSETPDEGAPYEVRVTFLVWNLGQVEATEEIAIRFRISADETVSEDDPVMGTDTFHPTEWRSYQGNREAFQNAAFLTFDKAMEWSYPEEFIAEHGTVHLLVELDPENELPEMDEENNQGSFASPVGPAGESTDVEFSSRFTEEVWNTQYEAHDGDIVETAKKVISLEIDKLGEHSHVDPEVETEWLDSLETLEEIRDYMVSLNADLLETGYYSRTLADLYEYLFVAEAEEEALEALY